MSSLDGRKGVDASEVDAWRWDNEVEEKKKLI